MTIGSGDGACNEALDRLAGSRYRVELLPRQGLSV